MESTSIKDLRSAVAKLGILAEEKVNKMRASTLMKILSETKTTPEVESPEVIVAEKVELYEGKVIVSKTQVEFNGNKFEDILVEGGTTYRNLIK